MSFKIVMIGKSFAGKSSLIIRFADDIFEESYSNTIGVDFVRFCDRDNSEKKFKMLKVDDTMVKLQIVSVIAVILTLRSGIQQARKGSELSQARTTNRQTRFFSCVIRHPRKALKM